MFVVIGPHLVELGPVSRRSLVDVGRFGGKFGGSGHMASASQGQTTEPAIPQPAHTSTHRRSAAVPRLEPKLFGKVNLTTQPAMQTDPPIKPEPRTRQPAGARRSSSSSRGVPMYLRRDVALINGGAPACSAREGRWTSRPMHGSRHFTCRGRWHACARQTPRAHRNCHHKWKKLLNSDDDRPDALHAMESRCRSRGRRHGPT